MTRRYDVYSTPGRTRSRDAGLVMVLQSHFTELDSVVVAPLLEASRIVKLEVVMIPVLFDRRELLVHVGELAAVARASLRRPLGSLASHHDAFQVALSRLFNGF